MMQKYGSFECALNIIIYRGGICRSEKFLKEYKENVYESMNSFISNFKIQINC